MQQQNNPKLLNHNFDSKLMLKVQNVWSSWVKVELMPGFHIGYMAGLLVGSEHGFLQDSNEVQGKS